MLPASKGFVPGMFKQIFKFLLTLNIFVCTSNPAGAQNVLIYAEDFENGPGKFTLNSPELVNNKGTNTWIINNQYDGKSLYPNTLEQNNTSGGLINFAPRSNYLHIHDTLAVAQGVSNACFNKTSASDRFATLGNFCTLGMDSVRIAFFLHMIGNPTSKVQLFFSANGGAWSPVNGGLFFKSPLWNYVELYDIAFNHINSLRFGFRWENGVFDTVSTTSVGIDGIRVVGKYAPEKYKIRLNINQIIPSTVCRGKELIIQFRNPVPLCGEGFYTVEMSNEFGSFANPKLSLTYKLDNLDTLFYLYPVSIPSNINPGNCYKFRIRRVDANPVIFSDTSQCVVIQNCPNNIYTRQPVVLKNPLDTLCVGSVIDIPFNSDGVFLNNTYIAQLSDSSGKFPANPNILGYSVDDKSYPNGKPPGNVSGLVREAQQPIPPGCNYYIRVVSSSPAVTGSVYGPFCIRRCDIETNEKKDIQFCIDDKNGADTTLKIRIKVYPPVAGYSKPNKFNLQVLNSKTFAIINTGVIGNVEAINDTIVQVSIPPLPNLSSVGLIPGMYYLRVVSTNSNQPWDQAGTLIRMTIGAPNPSGVTIELVDQNTYQTVKFDGDTTVCFLGGMLFRIKLSQYNTNSEYVWGLNNDKKFYTGGPYLSVLFNTLGTYTVYVSETNFGCQGPGSNKIIVTVKGPPSAAIIGPNQVCEGDTVEFKAPLSKDSYYYWSTFPGSVIDTLNNQAKITFPKADSSIIGLSVVNECYERKGTRKILVRKPPQFSLGPDTSICIGDTLKLSIPPGVNQKVYWKDKKDNIIGTDPTIYLPTDTTSSYSVRVTNYGSLACQAFDTIRVNVLNKTYLDTSLFSICEDDKVVLQSDSSAIAYKWNTYEKSRSITVDEPGLYYVNLYDGKSICPAVDVFQVNVSEKPETKAKIINICSGESYILDPDTNAISYLWSNGQQTKNITAKDSGLFFVQMAFDGAVCKVTDSFYVKIKVCFLPLILPNAFSPNGDMKNEFFKAEQTFNYDQFEMYIYNRWGLKVFQTNDPFFEWDGTDLNNRGLPEGTYFYVAHLKHQNKEDNQKGTITLLR